MSTVPPEALLRDTAWLRRLLQQLVGVEHADDLHQDVALAALRAPNGPQSRSWLAAVAHNLAVSWRRRRSAEARRMQHVTPSPDTPSPAELVATAELQQRAVAAVLTLPEPYRDTLLLRFLRGLSVGETAAAMGTTEETVRTRQKRALALVRERLGLRRDRRAAFLAALATFGAVVKAKHLFAVAAVLLLALVGVATADLFVGATPPSQAPVAVAAGAMDPAEVPTPDAPPVGPLQRTLSNVADTTPTTAGLLVTVLWDDGSPAIAVPVLCNDFLGTGPSIINMTDDRGEVMFGGLPPGRFHAVTLTHQSDLADLRAGQVHRCTFELARKAPITFEVRDATGTPVAGAEVLVSQAGIMPMVVFPVGTTDRHGRYVLHCHAGTCMVSASAGALGVSRAACMFSAELRGLREIVLQLDPNVTTLRGVVVDDGGTPLTGCLVSLSDGPSHWQPRGGYATPLPPHLVTGADGRFAFWPVQAASRKLHVYRRGFAAGHVRVALVPTIPHEITVTLTPGLTLRGRVIDEAGGPLAGVEVEAPWRPRSLCQLHTDSDGRFELGDLPAEPTTIRFSTPGRAPMERTFDPAIDASEWVVTLPKGHRILGRLLDEQGRPLVRWQLLADHGDYQNRYASTGDDGGFVLPCPNEHDNVVLAREGIAFSPSVVRYTNVPATEVRRDFVVPANRRSTARVCGQCLDAGGAPLADLTLDLLQDGDNVLVGAKVSRTAADGTFDIGPFPPGTYTITPAGRNISFEPIEVTLVPNDRRDLGVLRPRQR